MLTGLPGPKTIGIPSTATIDKGMTGLCATCHSPMVPAQSVGSTGALVQWKQARVIAILRSFRVLVFLHGVLRVFILIILRGYLAFLLCMRNPEHRHRGELGAGSVCSIAREGS